MATLRVAARPLGSGSFPRRSSASLLRSSVQSPARPHGESPSRHLAGALLELRDPPPTWQAFRHIPQIGCPRCDARHPGGPVFRLFPHHRYVCAKHQHWIGPPDLNLPGPPLHDFPEIPATQRRHNRLLRRFGWAATYDAVLTAFMICGHLWDSDSTEDEPTGLGLNKAIWGLRTLVFIPPDTERQTFGASKLFAAIYPEAVRIAEILADPIWRKMAAADDELLGHFCVMIGHRIGDLDYRPRDSNDPIAHRIEQDSRRPPSPPPTTFAAAPGHRRPSHLTTTITKANLDRHAKAAMWFSRARRSGNVILHHRTVHPVVIREWSTPMEQYAGAIWQSGRTLHRFKPSTENAK